MLTFRSTRSFDSLVRSREPEQGDGAERKARKSAREKQFTLQNYIPYLVNRLAIATLNYNAATSEFSKYGVPTYRILMALREVRVCRFGELARLTSIEPPTLSRLLNALEADGLIRRRRSISDTRSVMVSLSPTGRVAAKRLIPYSLSVEDIVIDGLSAKEVQLAKDLLKRMYENVMRQGQGMGKRK